MQVWAIRQWVGSLTAERNPESNFLSNFFFFLRTLPLPSLLGGFWGFRYSIVAPLLISAQQKKRAIRAIIVAAACFLAVQRQLRPHPGALVKRLEKGEAERAGPVAVGERKLEWSQ